jgi:flagellar basal body-associated protein FliL
MNKPMNKKLLLIILIVVVLALVGGGYYYWKTKTQKSATQQAAEDIQKTAANISADIGNNVSPDVTTPVVNLPNTDANPYNKTNPFSNLKTNPFK